MAWHQSTSHYLIQWWLDYWLIYTSLSLNELTPLMGYLKVLFSWPQYQFQSLVRSAAASLPNLGDRMQKSYTSYHEELNTLRPNQNGRHFPDNSFRCIFLNENVWISIKISLKFVPKGPIANNPALVQIIAWRRTGDKPLSEPILINPLVHICSTKGRWVNLSTPTPSPKYFTQSPKPIALLIFLGSMSTRSPS